MRISLPTIVYRNTGASSRHTVAPLFVPHHSVTRLRLSAATSSLANTMRDTIRSLSLQGQHQQLWQYLFDPNPILHRLTLKPELKREYLQVTLPIVTFRIHDQRFAFCPLLRQIWFDIERGENLAERATSFLAGCLRTRSEELADNTWIRFFDKKRRYWLSSIEIDVSLERKIEKPKTVNNLMELFGQSGPMDGEQEIHRVGRCLQNMYPDGLHHAFLRDDIVDLLKKWVQAKNRRPLLLVGEPLVGKTAIIHQWVRSDVNKHKSVYGGRAQTFLISPQRLISGMSYVGQWEERWNRILRTAKQKSHVLYFDDLLGMFAAGKSSSSNLSAAHVLKSFVERREVLVLAEMTPAQLRVLREKDRGFADMFEVVQVSEPNSKTTLHTLIQLLASLEEKYACEFGPEVIPNVLQLAKQFSTFGVLPGTAAGVLQQLASQNHEAEIDYKKCLDFFARRTGLDPAMVDRQKTLKRSDIEDFFETHLVGQPDAIKAMVDVVGIAKAQLSEGKRPLSTLLFAGPTGVGKTEAAKLLAQYLFGENDRLLRFDLNEFVDAGSAQRLIGTFDRPDGLLTNAVRQQPYNVLLLDEIEKAHPEVFDLLLQVLGEGRLTDARGRTVDFSKLIIIMTSNVGATEDAKAIGFVDSEETAQQRFMAAIRKFWRPEFFNRIDRIIAFRHLTRDDLAKIAEILLSKFLEREGFRRRPITVMGDQDAIDWVVDRGHSERLGGRAMRRAVQRDLAGPIANTMSGMLPSQKAIIRISRQGDAIQTAVLPLVWKQHDEQEKNAWKIDELSHDFHRLAERYIDAMLERCQNLPGADAFDDHNHPLAFERIATVDYLRRLKVKARSLEHFCNDHVASRSVIQPVNRPTHNPFKGGRTTRWTIPASSPDRRFAKEMHAFQDIEDYLQDDKSNLSAFEHVEIANGDEALNALIHDLRLLPLVVPKDDWNYQRVVVLVRAFNRVGVFGRRFLIQALHGLGRSHIERGIVNKKKDEEFAEDGFRVQRLVRESRWRLELADRNVPRPKEVRMLSPESLSGFWKMTFYLITWTVS